MGNEIYVTQRTGRVYLNRIISIAESFWTLVTVTATFRIINLQLSLLTTAPDIALSISFARTVVLLFSISKLQVPLACINYHVFELRAVV